MKQVYSNITPATGPHIAGVCRLKIAPREWLVNYIFPDFYTGIVTTPVQLDPDRNFINLDLITDSYDFEQKPKKSKAGDFFEVSLSGVLNKLDSDTQLILNTYNKHEFIVIIALRSGKYRIAGNKDAAMVMQFGHKLSNQNGGKESVAIEFSMQCEDPIPFSNWPIIQLGTPTLSIEDIESTSVILSWLAVDGATGYNVERATNSAFSAGLTTIYSGDLLTFTDTGLNPDTLYYYRIKCTGTNYVTSAFDTDSIITLEASIPTANLYDDWTAESGVIGTTDVTAWVGSVNAKSLTAVSGQEATLVASAINSLPAISSYGRASKLTGAENFPNLSTGGTVVIVAKQNTAGAYSGFDAAGTFLGAGNARDMMIFRGSNNDGAFGSIKGGINTATSADSNPIISEDTFYTIALRYDGTNMHLSINDTAEITAASDGLGYIATPLTIFKALSGAQGNKQIARMIIWTADIGTTNLGMVKTILKDKYAHY